MGVLLMTIVVIIGVIVGVYQSFLFFKKDIPRMLSKKIKCTECGREFKNIEVLIVCPYCQTKYIRHVNGTIKKQ